MLCYEIEGGKKCQLWCKRAKRHVQDYVSVQGCFRSLEEEDVQRFEEKGRKEQEYSMRRAT